MKTEELVKKLKGIHTIESIKSILNVKREKAIYYIHRLRKKGYIKTRRTSEGKRVYNISFENRLKGINPVDIINKYSTIKVNPIEDYQIYGKPPTPEETLIYAIKSQNLRIILASLALYKKIKNWSELYKLAKQNNFKRKVEALYYLARKIIKVRKMPKKFRRNCLPTREEKYEYIIPNLKSGDFKDIEKIWRVYIPFNKADLYQYKK